MVDPPPSPSKQRLQVDSGKLLGSSSSSGSGQYLDEGVGPKGSDPDGSYERKEKEDSSSSEEDSSTHGEELRPTNEEYYEDETSSDDERVEGFSTDDDDELPADTLHSIDEEKAVKAPKGPQHSTFPSSTLLIVLVMLIVVVVGVIVGCLSYYVWEREVLDPIAPPDVEIPSITTISVDPGSSNPLVPSDEALLDLFATVAGNATLVEDPESAYAMAADWMLYEDPGKEDITLLPRSDRAWIQRYILVYTYFATTSGEETAWLSCNPPAVDGVEDGLDESACMFSLARELPNQELVYDLVPSFRWLSGADECLWGGVACGTTIQEGITIDNGPNRPPTVTEYLRSAVTSIGLAGQNLEGSIVNDLAKLPYLDSLDLSHNSLEGSITEDFKTMKTLKLSHNEVSGSIPEGFFYEESPLEEFDIASNELTGSIPGTIGVADNLKIVKLSDNELGGTIPPLGNMPLETFHGDGNTFTGFLPFDYGYGGVWTSTLKEYWAYDNALTGTIPENIGFISELEDLRIHKNLLTGSIPESIGQLDELFRFEVYSNHLVGTIPESMGELSDLKDVKVQFNGLTGEVPSSMCFLESMKTLEANCFFTEDEVSGRRALNDIPVFGSLEEAVEAARAGGYVSTPGGSSSSSSSSSDGPTKPAKPTKTAPPPSDVKCYCCTKCCNPLTEQCLRFATSELTTHSMGV